MKHTPLQLKGAFVLDLEHHEDSRGWFARTWSQEEARAHGLSPYFAQSSISHNNLKGTVRGMHYQIAPHEEAKVVSCIRGSVLDVIIDLRPTSPTYMQHVAVELSASNHRQLYIPEGFAHGFQTLEDDTELQYHISASYAPDFARGVRWNDAAFEISWPLPVTMISDRDMAYPDFIPVTKPSL